MALDVDTGKKLWEFHVGSPLGPGGPSLGHGMLFVTTGNPVSTPNKRRRHSSIRISIAIGSFL